MKLVAGMAVCGLLSVAAGMGLWFRLPAGLIVGGVEAVAAAYTVAYLSAQSKR